MCLGIVGRVISFSADTAELSHVDVAGVTRAINVALLIEEDLGAGDWILIYPGLAMEKIDEATAMSQIAVLRDYTGHPE